MPTPLWKMWLSKGVHTLKGRFSFATRQRKEGAMAVKVLIKRRFKEKYFKEIVEIIKEHRYGAMSQDGYISSETLWDTNDPYRVVVASNWQSLQHWKAWKNSKERIAADQKIGRYLDGETAYETYSMGIYPH
jgi:heme-degrading monooxygenase HmoA